MKIYTLLLTLSLISGCVSNSASKKEEPSIKNGNQHIAVAITLAAYYCKNKHWPNNLDELESYNNEANLGLLTIINWGFLRHPETEFKISENIFLRIPGHVVGPYEFTVSSVNEPPVCDGGNIEVKSSMNLGS